MRKEYLLTDSWLFHLGDLHVQRPADKGPIYSQSKTERKQAGPAAYGYYDVVDPYRQMQGLAKYAEMKHDGWKRVSVPHDYVIDQDAKEQENNALGYLHYDNAWYRLHFTLKSEEAKGKRVLLRFDGIAGKSTIYLNGCLMYRNYSSYNTFEVDISDNVYYDQDNVIAVYVNTEEFEGWWYQGGGIYRNVHLTITEPVAIDLWGVYAPYTKMDGNRWQIDFGTTVVNSSFEDCAVIVKSQVLDCDGMCIAEAKGSGTIAFREKGVLQYSATVENPKLWDPEHPNLYTVKTVLSRDGVILDENSTRIGFRSIEVSAERGLLVNGKKTVIKGVCSHQDYGLTGLAVPENVAKYKIGLMKEMGANGFRTSHYMNSEANMDAFDELGFLVMNETRWFESTKESLEQLEALVNRDRNRPSVIFWSTGNEEYLHVTDNGRRIHKAMAAFIRKLDHTRLITAAVCETPDICTIYDECDAVGINYNLQLYDTVHSMRPEKPVIASECCATGTIRDWHYPTNQNGRVRDKDVDTNSWFMARERTWKFLMGKPYVLGCYQWAAVEHRGEAVWPAICSKSGALDLFLQKKGAFYQNQSHWTDAPMVHIVPHWNFRGLEGQEIPVTVYTNCDRLELYVNGSLFGEQEIERYGHGEWMVPYTPGSIEVKGYRNGELVCGDSRTTTKEAKRLRLTLQNEFQSNGRDLALFVCECLDEDGNVVPDAEEYVRFSVAAPARIVGTGSDNTDHNRVSLTERQMYMGKIAVAVKPEKGQTEMELSARSYHCGVTAIKIKCITK